MSAAPDQFSDLFTWNEEATVDRRLREALSSPEDLASLIQSPAWGIFTFPFLTPGFCDALMWFADNVKRYEPEPGDPYAGRELRTDQFAPMHAVMGELLDRYIAVLSEVCFDGYSVNRISDAFVLNYTMEAQRSMGLHFDDDSDVSLTIALNDKFEGGGLSFPRYGWTSKGAEPGSAVMFPGRVTHRHEGLEITGGVRSALVFWLCGREVR